MQSTWNHVTNPSLLLTPSVRRLQMIVAAVEFTQTFPGGAGSVIDVEVSTFALRQCTPGEYAQESPAICMECPAGSFTLEVHQRRRCGVGGSGGGVGWVR